MSTDVRDRGCLPAWWEAMYRRDESRVPAARFAEVMRPPDAAEVLDVIRRAGGGKSPGHDGLDIDFWKLVTGAPGSACLEVATRIIALSFELGTVPDVFKHGWITMVPKVKPDGSFSCAASDMRPITVLPELGKIASRLLARRVGLVLVQYPHLLAGAQRGFLMDGSVDQCTDVLLDVIEDWRQRAEGRGVADLFVVSYDQSKAYDSVQKYSIRASLERFNMPESFIHYVVSGLEGATSQVRTAGGLTESFDLHSGVRPARPADIPLRCRRAARRVGEESAFPRAVWGLGLSFRVGCGQPPGPCLLMRVC